MFNNCTYNDSIFISRMWRKLEDNAANNDALKVTMVTSVGGVTDGSVQSKVLLGRAWKRRQKDLGIRSKLYRIKTRSRLCNKFRTKQ